MNKLLKKASVMLIFSMTLISLMPSSALPETTNQNLSGSSLSTVSEDVYASQKEDLKELPTAIPSKTPEKIPSAGASIPEGVPSATPTSIPTEVPTPTVIPTATPIVTDMEDILANVEAGADFSTASDLPLNTEISGQLELVGDMGYFRFTTEKSGTYIIESSSKGEGSFELYDSEGVCIDSGDLSSYYHDVVLDPGEMFYIKITSTEENTSYNLKVNMPGDDHGYSKSSATEIFLNAEISGRIDFFGDSDYFKFTPDVDGVYSIKCSGDGDGYFNLDNSDGLCINYGNLSAESPYVFGIKLNANETYCLYGSGMQDLNYSVKISQEMLSNPSFTDDAAGWYFWKQGDAVANGTRDTEVYDSGDAGYRIDCTSNGSAINHIQLITYGIDVQAGKTYKLSFMAKSEGGSSNPTIELMQKSSPWKTYANKESVTIGSEWESYSVYFKCNTTDSNARMTFFLGDRMPDGGKLYLDSLSFVEYNELLVNPSFDYNTTGWAFWRQESALASGARDTVGFESSPAGFKIDCTNKGVSMNQIQLYTWGIKVEAGKKYKLTFKAKSENGDCAPAISLMQKSSPWKTYAKNQTVSIGSDWKTYEAYFDCNTTDSSARITFYLGNRMPDGSTLYIDSLSMVEVQ